jgi:hypothetical protein
MHDTVLVIAGSLTLLAAAVHGIVGHRLVVRTLTVDRLARTSFGSAAMTRVMLVVSWHLTTVGFLAAGCSLVAAGALLDGDAAQAAAVIGASQVTACAAVIVGLGAALTRSPQFVVRHPAPALVTLTAVLAWIGAT